MDLRDSVLNLTDIQVDSAWMSCNILQFVFAWLQTAWTACVWIGMEVGCSYSQSSMKPVLS